MIFVCLASVLLSDFAPPTSICWPLELSIKVVQPHLASGGRWFQLVQSYNLPKNLHLHKCDPQMKIKWEGGQLP